MKRRTKNIFRVPNFDPTYNELRKYIKKHQGEKGYILTESTVEDHDVIYALLYSDDYYNVSEPEVKAVRVKENIIEVILDYGCIYDEETVAKAETEKKEGTIGVWLDLRWDDYVMYPQTLLNIAEHIREYTGEWACDYWYNNTDFETMERISGLRVDDYSDEYGNQDFVDACDDWWYALKIDEKKAIMNREIQ